MDVDFSRTGPKYIAYLVELDLVAIERKPSVDRRVDFVVPTKKLLELVDAELVCAVQLAIAITPPDKRLCVENERR